MNTADKEVEVFEWMKKQGYDRRACKDIAPIIVKYLEQSRQAAVSGSLPLPYLCPACDGECSVTHEPVYKCGVCHGIFGGNDR